MSCDVLVPNGSHARGGEERSGIVLPVVRLMVHCANVVYRVECGLTGPLESALQRFLVTPACCLCEAPGPLGKR